ncbi:MAG: quinolinate synthase NadA [Bacteriovoracaceae bacterium]|jgi:quinolinate synthase|nr:quinolinate synthase NadA [Bacteriovoracaceae bacterium]
MDADHNKIHTENFSNEALEAEADRLFSSLMNLTCNSSRKWTYEECQKIAPKTLLINRLKKEHDAVILAHSYVEPEIVHGVADFKSDSYALSLAAKDSKASMIIFAGVVFMAETAKIVSPKARVFVPDRGSACSLADSINADQVKELKREHPGCPVVCYINSTAEVKAESDVCVTSTNVYSIIESLDAEKIIFIPDRLMADNIIIEMKKRGINKEIVSSDGTCFVHDQFDHNKIDEQRIRYPGLKVVSHPECLTDVTKKSDFVGSTGAMMDYVRKTEAPYFMMLTECGLVSRLEVEEKEKNFIGACRLCEYMKLNSLDKIIQVFENPRADQEVFVEESTRLKAKRAIDKMFELSP